MISNFPEFYNFKLKIVKDSEESKKLAEDIAVYFKRWCKIADEDDIIRYDESEYNIEDNKKVLIKSKSKADLKHSRKGDSDNTNQGFETVYEGCIKFYFVCYDNKGLMDWGKEINRLNNGSFLSFYYVKLDSCKHYLYGNIKEIELGTSPEDMTEYYGSSVACEIELDNDLLEDLFSGRIPVCDNKEEMEDYKELLEAGIFDEEWDIPVFEIQTAIHKLSEYKECDPVYEQGFGYVGFNKSLWENTYCTEREADMIMLKTRYAKALASKFEEVSGYKTQIEFTGLSYEKFKLRDENMQPTDDCIVCEIENALQIVAIEKHSIINIYTSGNGSCNVVEYE